jgi:hypothetical protein
VAIFVPTGFRLPTNSYVGNRQRTAPLREAIIAASKKKPGTPGSPVQPAPGSYDPALDAALRAAERGFGDLQLDSEKQGERASSQRELDIGSVQRGSGRSLADLLRDRGRARADYSSRRGDIRRGYRDLGSSQAQAAAQQGVAAGGSLRAALAARTENQGRDIGEVDLSEARFMDDSRSAEGRMIEDRDLAIGEIERLFGYGGVDRAEALDMALRELGFFRADTAEQRAFQAAQAGMLPEGRSKPKKGKGKGKGKGGGKRRSGKRRPRLRTTTTGRGGGLGG